MFKKGYFRLRIVKEEEEEKEEEGKARKEDEILLFFVRIVNRVKMLDFFFDNKMK